VLLADLCAFSSFVRDTADHDIVRESLTSFYSKARYQIINSGGMLYQFVGDQVIGLFGIPDQPSGFAEAALDTVPARSVESVNRCHNTGSAVSIECRTPRVFMSGVALGDIQIVSLRPFSRMHIGADWRLYQRGRASPGACRTE
jgi:hypothetical protein